MKKIVSGTLTVNYSTYTGGETVAPPVRLSPSNISIFNEVQDSVVNADEIQFSGNYVPRLAAVSGKADTYYILTTEHIKNNSTMLDLFIKSKVARNFDVYLVTEIATYHNNSVNNSGWSTQIGLKGNAAAENIRSYLTESNRFFDIDYLLLIGDPHPGTCAIQAGNMNRFVGLTKVQDCLNDDTDAGDVL
jgi:hypothetical protein